MMRLYRELVMPLRLLEIVAPPTTRHLSSFVPTCIPRFPGTLFTQLADHPAQSLFTECRTHSRSLLQCVCIKCIETYIPKTMFSKRTSYPPDNVLHSSSSTRRDSYTTIKQISSPLQGKTKCRFFLRSRLFRLIAPDVVVVWVGFSPFVPYI